MTGAVGRALAAVALALAVSAAPNDAARAGDGTPVVSGMRHRAHDGRLRLTLDIAPVPGFSLFTLSRPDRLVIDFAALDWRLDAQAFAGVPWLAGVRVGLFRRDRARVVLELAEPLRVERASTQPARKTEPGRLVIELAPTTREAFDATAGAPEKARWQGVAPPAPAGGAGIVIAIDPGHGGIDPGAGEGGLTEKTVVLAFARLLAAEIDRRPGLRAYLIRTEDEFVPLAERIARARRAGANALISVHADSVASGEASGVSVYTLSREGSDEAAETLAARENRADVLAGADLGGETDDLTRLLVELAQRGTLDESAKLARALLRAFDRRIDVLRSRPLRQANFRVLKAPDLPSVLLELGFLDSEADRLRLADPVWMARTARAVTDGLADWRRIASPGFLSPRAR